MFLAIRKRKLWPKTDLNTQVILPHDEKPTPRYWLGWFSSSKVTVTGVSVVIFTFPVGLKMVASAPSITVSTAFKGMRQEMVQSRAFLFNTTPPPFNKGRHFPQNLYIPTYHWTELGNICSIHSSPHITVPLPNRDKRDNDLGKNNDQWPAPASAPVTLGLTSTQSGPGTVLNLLHRLANLLLKTSVGDSYCYHYHFTDGHWGITSTTTQQEVLSARIWAPVLNHYTNHLWGYKWDGVEKTRHVEGCPTSSNSLLCKTERQLS